jgi:3-oxoacyl-[acyl-carrier-protein] synthase-3
MGSIVTEDITGVENPRVALLNIGAEDTKGHDTVKDAAAMLTASTLNYVGFIEGSELFTGKADVVVTDGFTGNVALKTMEGTVGLAAHYLKRAFTRNLFSKFQALLARPVLKHLRKRMDPRDYNGATLVGLNGIVIKSHGSCDQHGCCRSTETGAAADRKPAAKGSRMTYSRIVGTGRYLPEKILTNFDLEKIVDTSDEWIRTRTGVERRHCVAEDQTTSDMCVEAAKVAIEDAGIKPEDIEMVVIGTTSPDLIFPNAATLVQHRLGIPACPCIATEEACTSFIYGVSIADQFIKSGEAKCILVIGAECITKLVDWNDRNTCVLFGDGAGAVILKASEEPGILATHLGADGQYKDLLYYPVGASKELHKAGTDEASIMMTGNEVFKVAVKTLGNVATEVLEKAGIEQEELDWLVPHQANIRIIQATAKRLDLPMDKVILTVQDHGNTSAASVPMALDVGIRDGRIKKGQLVLMEAFGGGFTWGSVLMRL